ncbi:MAG: hypothetical protein ACF8XB_03965, partial [Planctomycetota bacterium JB042]
AFGDVLLKLGQSLRDSDAHSGAEAEATLREAIDLLDRTRSSTSLEALVGRASLAEVLSDSGRLAGARALLSDVHVEMSTALEPADPRRLDVAVSLADVLLSDGDPAAAEALLEGALPHLVERHGATGDAAIEALVRLARAIAARSPAEAIARLEANQEATPHPRIAEEIDRLRASDG